MFNQLNQITMETKFTKGEWVVKRESGLYSADLFVGKKKAFMCVRY